MNILHAECSFLVKTLDIMSIWKEIQYAGKNMLFSYVLLSSNSQTIYDRLVVVKVIILFQFLGWITPDLSDNWKQEILSYFVQYTATYIRVWLSKSKLFRYLRFTRSIMFFLWIAMWLKELRTIPARIYIPCQVILCVDWHFGYFLKWWRNLTNLEW